MPANSKADEFYFIENPNKLMKYFFTNYFNDLRHIGRFTGFATSKTLFYDIPDFNKMPIETVNIWKEFVDENGNPVKSVKQSKKRLVSNNANNRKSKKANNVEPDYMRDCPQEILDKAKSYQVTKSECLRYNEDPTHPLKKSKKKKKKFKVKSKSK